MQIGAYNAITDHPTRQVTNFILQVAGRHAPIHDHDDP